MSETRNVIVGLSLAALLGLGILNVDKIEKKLAESARPRIEKSEKVDLIGEQQKALATYMSDEKFGGKNFARDYLQAPVELEIYDVRRKSLYFSVKETDWNEGIASKIAINPDTIEFGSKESGYRTLHGKTIMRGKYLFAMPVSQLPVERAITRQVGGFSITFTPEMLNRITDEEGFNNGYMKFITGYDGNIALTTINFNGRIVEGRDSMLGSLADLISEKAANKDDEAQRILDFVSRHIEYDNQEKESNIQTVKRPHEVLLAGKATCASMSVLYSSLLKQRNINHLLTYMNQKKREAGHVAIAVETQSPVSLGAVSFTFNGKNYALADPVVRGYKIRIGSGEASLSPIEKLEDIDYLQGPNKGDRVYNARTGNTLKFFGEDYR